MKGSHLKQIQNLGVVLPFDLGIFNPLKIIPVNFSNTKVGAFVRSELQESSIGPLFTDLSLQANNLTFPEDVVKGFRELSECFLELVFIRRNYDGSEQWYLVTDMTLKQLIIFESLLKSTEGGILL